MHVIQLAVSLLAFFPLSPCILKDPMGQRERVQSEIQRGVGGGGEKETKGMLLEYQSK